MTNGWSSMGFGVPAALAAKLCRLDRKVVCVTGDGGFLMMAGEMAVARREGLAVVFVILADEGWISSVSSRIESNSRTSRRIWTNRNVLLRILCSGTGPHGHGRRELPCRPS
ncbi:MAG: thiamine pyrophosphate-dependent enzyme [Candidatus Moduliflexus flocculans]|nr:thiamine pyrophosphate-dependent enzyme [Candidatus Moduliflexus flocculans]